MLDQRDGERGHLVGYPPIVLFAQKLMASELR